MKILLMLIGVFYFSANSASARSFDMDRFISKCDSAESFTQSCSVDLTKLKAALDKEKPGSGDVILKGRMKFSNSQVNGTEDVVMSAQTFGKLSTGMSNEGMQMTSAEPIFENVRGVKYRESLLRNLSPYLMTKV